jgi:hypothetical protein
MLRIATLGSAEASMTGKDTRFERQRRRFIRERYLVRIKEKQ